MAVLAMDLGGTKLATAVFSEKGDILSEEKVLLQKRQGTEVGRLIAEQVKKYLGDAKCEPITSIGICIPGISRNAKGTVWAPNIPGWEDYPLKDEIQLVAKDIPVALESDRVCYILGEHWKGAAIGCTDAIFLAVGTGIGAGILANGKVLRGAHDAAGSIGWMALEPFFDDGYAACGCFESRASGEGMVKLAKNILLETNGYGGPLTDNPQEEITAHQIFRAFEVNDPVAVKVIEHCIKFWGMSIANLVSLFDPQKIIIGGGVFGPGVKFISAIRKEAEKWAQPVSFKEVIIEASALGDAAGLYGAALLALQL